MNSRLKGSLPPGRVVVLRTSDTHLLRPRPPRDGRSEASNLAPADLPQDLVPGNSVCLTSLKLVQSPVEFFPLRIGQGHRVRRLAEALPEIGDEAEPFIGTQASDVHGLLTHDE